MIKRLLMIFTVSCLLVFSGCTSHSNHVDDPSTQTAKSNENSQTKEVSNSSTQNAKNNKNPESLVDKNFAKNVNLLQKEMKRYSQNTKSLSPKEVNDISISCIKALKDVLSAKDSIKATGKELLGAETSFYIKFGKEISKGSTKYRFIEFGNTNDADGAISDLLLKEVNDKNEILVRDVVKLTSTSSGIEKLVYYDFVNSGNSNYIVAFSKFNGAEVKLARLYGFKLEGKKLSLYKFSNTKSNKSWKLDNSTTNGIWDIRYKNDARDYNFSLDNELAKVQALDVNGKVLSEVKFSSNNSNGN